MALSMAVRPEPADGASDLFDQNALHTYEILLDEQNLALLDSNPQAEQYVAGRLRFEGQDVGGVGVRYKGSVGAFRSCIDPSGHKACTKLSMKVKVDWLDPDAKFHGLRKLQFHAMNRDPSMMKERLGYWVFRQFGVAAPRAVHARLLINGQLSGLYALIEQIDGRFTRSRFVEGGEGNLYKEVWPLLANGSAVTEERLLPQLQTNEDEDPTFDKMLAFAEALASQPLGDLSGVLEQYMDADYLMRYVTVDRTIRHDDGPFHWYCGGTACQPHNFYLYEESAAPRLWLIAWDLDSAFNVDNLTTTLWIDWDDTTAPCRAMINPPFNSPLRPAYCDRAQHAMALMQQRYLDDVRDLLAGPLSPEQVSARLEEWEEQVYPVVLEAAAAHPDAVQPDAWQQARAWLRASIERLRENAQARLERGEIPRDVLLGPGDDELDAGAR